MTAPEQPPVPVVLVDPDTLTHAQEDGWDCVFCGLRLIERPGRPVGTVTVKRGSARVPREVWACAPACGTEPGTPEPTAWSQFLDHAADCAECRPDERCAAGNELFNTARDEVHARAAAQAAP